MDFTRVRNITGGTIKKLKLNLSRANGPSTEQKLHGSKRKLTETVNLHMNRKSVPPMDFTYVRDIIGGTMK